jgi:hypothetical protein
MIVGLPVSGIVAPGKIRLMSDSGSRQGIIAAPLDANAFLVEYSSLRGAADFCSQFLAMMPTEMTTIASGIRARFFIGAS